MTTSRQCVLDTRSGRQCRRPGPWRVIGDPDQAPYCKPHATSVALRLGGSALITRPGAGRLDRVDVDPHRLHVPVGPEQLAAAYDAVTCDAGYRRVREAWFHPPKGAAQVSFRHRDVSHAEIAARGRLNINAAAQGGPL